MAIAFDIAGISSGTGDRTLSLATAAGSSLILAAAVNTNAAGDTITGITWNGNTMSLLAKKEASGGAAPFFAYLFAIAGSDTGTHDVITAGASGAGVHLLAASYTGTATTNPTNIVTDSFNNSSQGEISEPITISAATSWIFAFGAENNSGGDSWTADVTTSRAIDADTARSIGDSNGTVTAASHTVTWDSVGTSPYWTLIICEIEVAAATSIKTWNGLANASTKTYDGLALASRKTFNGLA